MIVGRAAEIQALITVLDEATRHRGGALVVRGEAGIGKSALWGETCALAEARGMRVLTTVGVQAEVQLPYAGVGHLFRRLRPEFGAVEGESPFRVGVEVLDLLGGLDGPVLLAVEDAHWLDRASWEVLAFVARRLESDPVALVLTARDGEDVDRLLAAAALPELRLEPLEPIHAGALIDQVAPGLPPALRERVLSVSVGNPLGLVELGGLAARSGGAALVPSRLPLSARVERTFAGLVGELPAATRALLLVAALDDGDDLDEVLAAASRLEDRPVTADDMEPAVVSRLVSVDEQYRLRFRHPLLRSALRQSANATQRRRAHACLAVVVAGDDRRVWHRAAAAAGPDETLAADLAAVATRARYAQAASIALTAMERAAQLSEDPQERGSRLLWAAMTADEQGDDDATRRLLALVDETQLRPAELARLYWYRESLLGTGWSGIARLGVFIDLIDTMRRAGDVELTLDALTNISLRFYWSNPDDTTRLRFVDVAELIDAPDGDTRVICALAEVAPVERGASCLERLTAWQYRLDLAPRQRYDLGFAASALGAYTLSNMFLAASADALRTQGRIGMLTNVLTSLAYNAATTGDARAAVSAATECMALATETRQPIWALQARLQLGMAEALRGNGEIAAEIADVSEKTLLTAGMHAMLSLTQRIRGINALASGRFEEAFGHLHRVFDPGDAAYHPYLRFTLVGHLTEAATYCGALDEVRAVVSELTPIAAQSRSPVLITGLRYAEAVLADDPAAYEAAIAADLRDWPFERARLQLTYGGWLRRQRQAAESRPLLRAAAATFDALGAAPWAERARAELRATGESRRKPIDAIDVLTPQEQQIARLAADGLSNRQIAEQLFLSPRTVTTHLYRIYPKVGVKSRSELAAMMAERPF
ncbi:DNA-binding response regulator, NarL/FixJ family, contains REC and HTH domains [Streptosporangium subroseum]|uniref:DNA-binding response regulator, NarL/FixJ family, contains REC and HTH domains n=1 Tax=Streptosporangium subroseum TaxID=106412 RepID=A0A239NMR0_9ACTN|nr:helix-turn-helix transcriptional regulator [Streptosporangium subroseum]SNT55694.1 DNA-binding response regulator, NarL/FixJ family, contains REC and HTH domains [Streptosporangium subroseum]